ncbi:MAG: M20/M25/M40 family metallo-hydrolase [Bacillota bacterium]|nr:M20/M25/M40 family metallo-hydrolase [Bacillota bacterium]
MRDMQILDLLKKLIAVRSDNGTVFEKKFEQTILSIIKNMDYFVQNPNHFGSESIEDDLMGRRIVWAFKDNSSEKTVVLFGHYDTVGLEMYENYDYDEDEDWLYGRGSCDMKAGLAIQLRLMEKIESTDCPNLILISVPDEEGMSVGMRSASMLLKRLKKQFKLTYNLAILSEPQQKDDNRVFKVHTGSVGKMLPFIMTKGSPSHAGIPFSGLSSVGLMNEIIKAIEFNTEMGDIVERKMSPPPIFLGIKSMKNNYDVTMPEFTASYFNWLFLKDDLDKKMNQLKSLCVWSAEDAINQYNYSYNEFLRKQGLPSYECCHQIDVEVLFYDELMEVASEHVDTKAFIERITSDHTDLSTQDLSLLITKGLLEAIKSPKPMIVIGLLAPYYAVVDSGDHYESVTKGILEKSVDTLPLELQREAYFMGISDMSFIKSTKNKNQRIKKLMPVDFRIHFDVIDELGIEVINIGPWGKDLHKITERVYIPDVVETVPEIIRDLIRNL